MQSVILTIVEFHHYNAQIEVACRHMGILGMNYTGKGDAQEAAVISKTCRDV